MPWAPKAKQLTHIGSYLQRIAGGQPAAPSPAAMDVAAREAKAAGEPAARGFEQHLQAIYDLARQAGPATASGYPVRDFETYAAPTRGERGEKRVRTLARIRKTNLDEALRGYYGPDYEVVRESITAQPTPPEMQFLSGARTQAQNLEAPLFEVTTRPPGEGTPETRSYSKPHLAVTSLDQAQRLGMDPSVLRSHEVGHHAARYMPLQAGTENPRRELWVYPSQSRREMAATVRQRLLSEHPELASNPVILNDLVRDIAMGGRLTWPELSANLMQMRRYDYGLTGNRMLSDSEAADAARRWVGAPPQAPGKPARALGKMFPEEPTYQYGPSAGRPAVGYSRLLETMRHLLPLIPNPDKQRVITILRHGADANAAPKDTQYA